LVQTSELATGGKRANNARGMATVEKLPVSTLNNVDLPLFRFGLRQLLSFVGAVSVLFAALVSAGGLAALVLLLFVLVVVMHVFATTLGGHLRAKSDREHQFEAADSLPIESIASKAERRERLAAVRSGPRSPWHNRGTTILPWLRKLVISAIACGAVVGTAYLAVKIGYRTSPAGVVVGGISVAVLFGWFAFLFGSFYGVFRHGFRDAVAGEKVNRPAVPAGRAGTARLSNEPS
jgi:hypothetical protein